MTLIWFREEAGWFCPGTQQYPPPAPRDACAIFSLGADLGEISLAHLAVNVGILFLVNDRKAVELIFLIFGRIEERAISCACSRDA